MKDIDIKYVSRNISNYLYENNLEVTEQLVKLFDKISRKPLYTEEDYIRMYDNNFYTYRTWEELVRSEVEQGSYGLTEKECKEQLNETIWQLPCGWYVQYV
jgi:hypothetical protein